MKIQFRYQAAMDASYILGMVVIPGCKKHLVPLWNWSILLF